MHGMHFGKEGLAAKGLMEEIIALHEALAVNTERKKIHRILATTSVQEVRMRKLSRKSQLAAWERASTTDDRRRSR